MKIVSLVLAVGWLSAFGLGETVGAQNQAELPAAEDQTPAGEQDSGANVAGQAPPSETGPGKFNKVTSLIGMEVRNHHNEKIGSIKDIVIEVQSQRVAYAVLATGGVLGFGEKLLPVPINVFFPDPERQYLIIRAEKKDIEKAQGFDLNNWPGLDKPFQEPPFWQPPPDKVEPPSDPPENLPDPSPVDDP